MEIQTDEEPLDIVQSAGTQYEGEPQNDSMLHKFDKQLLKEIFKDFMSAKQEIVGMMRDLNSLSYGSWINNKGNKAHRKDFVSAQNLRYTENSADL